MKTNHLPDMIREARQRAKLTQAELAERAGLTQPDICNYEKGRKTPNAAPLIAIVGAIGCRFTFDGSTTLGRK